MFTEEEIAYMNSQRLARIGTVSADTQPDVSPVGFRYDGKVFRIRGRSNRSTRKYKNVAHGNVKVALSIDDLESVNPWKPRGIRIFGTAEITGDDTLLIKPTISWSWNLEGPSMVDGRFVPHKTIHEQER